MREALGVTLLGRLPKNILADMSKILHFYTWAEARADAIGLPCVQIGKDISRRRCMLFSTISKQ